MLQLAQCVNANLLALLLKLSEGFYRLEKEEGNENQLRPTPLLTSDHIVFHKGEKVFSIIRNDVDVPSNSIRWSNGDRRFYLGANQTKDFLIVARFIGLLYDLRVEVIDEDGTRVFARFV